MAASSPRGFLAASSSASKSYQPRLDLSGAVIAQVRSSPSHEARARLTSGSKMAKRRKAGKSAKTAAVDPERNYVARLPPEVLSRCLRYVLDAHEEPFARQALRFALGSLSVAFSRAARTLDRGLVVLRYGDVAVFEAALAREGEKAAIERLVMSTDSSRKAPAKPQERVLKMLDILPKLLAVHDLTLCLKASKTLVFSEIADRLAAWTGLRDLHRLRIESDGALSAEASNLLRILLRCTALRYLDLFGLRVIKGVEAGTHKPFELQALCIDGLVGNGFVNWLTSAPDAVAGLSAKSLDIELRYNAESYEAREGFPYWHSGYGVDPYYLLPANELQLHSTGDTWSSVGRQLPNLHTLSFWYWALGAGGAQNRFPTYFQKLTGLKHLSLGNLSQYPLSPTWEERRQGYKKARTTSQQHLIECIPKLPASLETLSVGIRRWTDEDQDALKEACVTKGVKLFWLCEGMEDE